LNAEDKKKKIGILTLNQQLNYGGVLQSYALQGVLNKNDYDAEVIRFWHTPSNAVLYGYVYNPSSWRKIRNIRTIVRAQLRNGLAFSDLCRRLRTINFINTQMKTSARDYKSADELEGMNEYDVLISGSDQIWNSYWGTPNPFLLGFARGVKKIAYAPSFGLSVLPQEWEEEYGDSMNDFFALSAREPSGRRIISSLTGKECPWVLDPVMLISSSEWERRFRFKAISGKHFSCYWVGDLQTLPETLSSLNIDKKAPIHLMVNDDLVNEIYAPRNAKGRISLLKKLKNEYVNLKFCFEAGPIEFVRDIATSKGVISDSYHGMMFSVLFHKPLRVFLGNLLAADRIVGFSERMNMLDAISQEPSGAHSLTCPDYERITSELDVWRKESMNFLFGALEACKKNI
jgi:hypothetical protein